MTERNPAKELDLRDYLAVLQRRRWIVAVTTVVVVIVAVVASLLQTKVYGTSADVLLQPRTSELIFNPNASGSTRINRTDVQNEIEVMQSRSIRAAADEAMGGPVGVGISEKGDTSVVSVRAEDVDPARAARIANTYARTYIKIRRDQLVADLLLAGEEVQAKIADIDRQLTTLGNQIEALDTAVSSATSPAAHERAQADRDRIGAELESQRQALQNQRALFSGQLSQFQLAANLTRTGGAQLVSEAAVPGRPIRPTPKRNGLLALIMGGILGIGLAFLFEYLDDSVKNKEILEATTEGLTVLGLIPLSRARKADAGGDLVARHDPASASAEAYRSLRTSLQFIAIEHPTKLLQVTSASAAEGKTTTLANLAVALANTGQRVLMVCCDLRRPRIHDFFGLGNQVGFTSVLVGSADLPSAIQTVPGIPNLRLLASGPPPPNPSELLSSARAQTLFATLRNEADIVLVDSPPLLPVTDGLVIAGRVDATIVVARAGRTTRRDLHRAVELLGQVGAPVVGTVLNGAGLQGRYGYGYGYGQGNTYGGRYRYRYRKSRPAANHDVKVPR